MACQVRGGSSRVNLKEVVDEDGSISTGSDAVRVWRSHFESLLGDDGIGLGEAGRSSGLQMQACTLGQGLDFSEQLNGPILQEEIDWALGKVRSEAAPGADGISVSMMCAIALKDVWLPLFNVCWSCGIVPSIWSKSVIVPVPKTRQRGTCVPDDFRGICLTSVVCKVFCLILNERLSVVAEENRLLADEQLRWFS